MSVKHLILACLATTSLAMRSRVDRFTDQAGGICSVTESPEHEVKYGVSFRYEVPGCNRAKCSPVKFFGSAIKGQMEARQMAATCNCMLLHPAEGAGERILFSYRGKGKFCKVGTCWEKLSQVLFIIKAKEAQEQGEQLSVTLSMASHNHWIAQCTDGATGSTGAVVPDLSGKVHALKEAGLDVEETIKEDQEVIVPPVADVAVKDDEEEVYDPEVFEESEHIPAVSSTTTETTTTEGHEKVHEKVQVQVQEPEVETTTTTSTPEPAAEAAEEHVEQVELLIEEGKSCPDLIQNGKPCSPINTLELCREAAALVTSTSGAQFHTFLDPTTQYPGGCVLRSTMDKVAHVWWNGIENPMPARKMARGALGWVPICSCGKA